MMKLKFEDTMNEQKQKPTLKPNNQTSDTILNE